MPPAARPLGRRKPTDRLHIEKYPLSASQAELVQPIVPIAVGVNWYTNFDSPEKIGTRYYVGRGNLGSIRGGHCFCLKPPSITDSIGWWEFYDQLAEGACVGFGNSRVMTLLNRKRYDAKWLYHEAQLIDEYSDTPPAEGTSVRAGLEMLRTKGAMAVVRGVDKGPFASDGISAFRWITDVEDIRKALGQSMSALTIPFLNSWGRSYPHITYMPYETMQQLLDEEGEAAVITDR